MFFDDASGTRSNER